MVNTTDLMITLLFDEDVIELINKETNLDFKQFSDGAKAGGTKVVGFEVYGACHRCIGKEKINNLIEVFKQASIDNPEYAKLFIDDDNDEFCGVINAIEQPIDQEGVL